MAIVHIGDMKRQHLIGLAIVLCILGVIGVFRFRDRKLPDEVRIGFVGTQSGPASFVGVEIRRGAEIAIDELNEKGGVKGARLSLVARDDEHEPAKTVPLYRELVEREGVVGMIGAANSASMLAVAPVVNDSLKIPVICPATDASAITDNDAMKQGRDNYLFRVGMYGHGQANFMVDTAVKKLGFTKIGLLTWKGGWGVTGRAEILRRLGELNMTPVADEAYGETDTDMTAQLLKLDKAGAQCILNYGLVRDNAAVIKTRKLLKNTIPYISAWGIAGPAFWSASGDAAEGVCVSTTVTIDGPQTKARQAFVEKYRAKYGDFVAPVFAVGAYDCVRLLALSMETGGFDRKAIRDGLEAIPSFDGLVKVFDRPVFTRERHNAVTEDDMILARWTDGKLLPIQFDDKGPFVEIDSSTRRYIDVQTMALK